MKQNIVKGFTEKQELVKNLSRRKKRLCMLFCLLALTAVQVCFFGIPVFAAEAGGEMITSGFEKLQGLVAAFVSSVGFIIVLWGLFEWGNSMQSNDGMMQSQAFKRIGGGLVMTLGPQLLNLFI